MGQLSDTPLYGSTTFCLSSHLLSIRRYGICVPSFNKHSLNTLTWFGGIFRARSRTPRNRKTGSQKSHYLGFTWCVCWGPGVWSWCEARFKHLVQECRLWFSQIMVLGCGFEAACRLWFRLFLICFRIPHLLPNVKKKIAFVFLWKYSPRKLLCKEPEQPVLIFKIIFVCLKIMKMKHQEAQEWASLSS